MAALRRRTLAGKAGEDFKPRRYSVRAMRRDGIAVSPHSSPRPLSRWQASVSKNPPGMSTFPESPVLERSPTLLPSRYVLLPLANAVTGYSVKAMERKIERGDWREGKVWKRAPDGRILIDMVGYQRWVEGR
jgi:hypothetical protein